MSLISVFILLTRSKDVLLPDTHTIATLILLIIAYFIAHSSSISSPGSVNKMVLYDFRDCIISFYYYL